MFSANMSKKSEPKITACKPSDNWTCVTFKPDLAKFGMDTLENDAVMLMKKRVFDMAGLLGKSVKVRLQCSAASPVSFLTPELLRVRCCCMLATAYLDHDAICDFS